MRPPQACVLSQRDVNVEGESSEDRKLSAYDSQQPAAATADRRTAAVAAAAANTAQAERACEHLAATTAAAARATEDYGDSQRIRPDNIPKWIRVGSKVCFSTVVAAVLIPSVEDITEASKRELWWQAADYVKFRMNYSLRMQNPSLEEDEEDDADNARKEERDAIPMAAAAAVSLGQPVSTYPAEGAAGAGNFEPTVQGVLVVAAAPAPAAVASRSYSSGDSSRAAAATGGRHSEGTQKNGVGSYAPQQLKATRQEWAARGRSSTGGVQEQQPKNRGRGVAGGGSGGPTPPHHAAFGRELPGVQHPTRNNSRPSSSRRDTRHDSYYPPRGSNSNNVQYRGAPGGQFYVNNNPAGVYGPPPPPLPPTRMAGGPGGYGQHGPYYGNGGAMAEAFMPAQHQRGQITSGSRGSTMAPTTARVGASNVVVVRMPSPSQFSMWRSQLVFSPLMMQ